MIKNTTFSKILLSNTKNKTCYQPALLRSFSDQKDPKSYSSINQEEVLKFSENSQSWWDPKGPFMPLHSMNPSRVEYIRNIWKNLKYKTLSDQDYNKNPAPFSGSKIVDVGCGGGLLSESLSRLGGQVLGVDASPENIGIARAHMLLDPSFVDGVFSLDYIESTAEKLVEEKKTFDLVTSVEVIEHVENYHEFLKSLADLTSPGGLLVMSTINRTILGRLLCVAIPEYLLNVVPRGTHDYEKFVKPEEISRVLEQVGLKVVDVTGIWYKPISNTWKLQHRNVGPFSDAGIQSNYLISAVKL
ncbi:hypothetical protein BB558_004912 [Smittium angustum]|uniref:Ubiquinone biosynthesis O-methyltransferase, mitochondrial n=1 Tax=Smittium angustum TaxID=133377 RepID=A0A2U1J1Z5_SMIAN|nr:hypothetical protein BB558_004912 [Smittium angustum]